MKRFQNAWIARRLADLLVDARGDRLREAAADLVVPVPLHWRRRLRRGYNQAEALATALAARLGIARSNSLVRLAATPKLYLHGRRERADLMRDAFGTKKSPGVAGKTVMLVDDVLTTGATCGAAARVLKKAGASRVIAVVLARAEGRT
jgi:ComF family protein